MNATMEQELVKGTQRLGCTYIGTQAAFGRWPAMELWNWDAQPYMDGRGTTINVNRDGVDDLEAAIRRTCATWGYDADAYLAAYL